MAACPAFLRISPKQNQRFYKNSFHQFSGFRLPSSHLGVLKLSKKPQSLISKHFAVRDSTTPIHKVPLLSCEEAIEMLRLSRERHKDKQQFLAMYSSVFGGIITDTAAMMIPMDDHMVHRGHGIFDTALIVEGHLYELDQHLDRFVKSASMAKISLPFDRATMRSILIQTVTASKCRNGALRYWLSAGHGNFSLSPTGCLEPTFYAIVTQDSASSDRKGIKVITSSIPMKPPMFATMKSVNYLPNALCQMEAEEKGCYASIWLDSEGFVAEGPHMNVAFVTYDKELLMPRFDRILSGCTTKRMLTLSQELVKKGDIRGVSAKNVTVEEGKKAGEMMLLGSGVQVRPIVQWDDQVIGNGNEGPIAQALFELLMEDMKSGPSTVRTPVPY